MVSGWLSALANLNSRPSVREEEVREDTAARSRPGAHLYRRPARVVGRVRLVRGVREAGQPADVGRGAGALRVPDRVPGQGGKKNITHAWGKYPRGGNSIFSEFILPNTPLSEVRVFRVPRGEFTRLFSLSPADRCGH